MKNPITAAALIFASLLSSILYMNSVRFTYTPVEYPESTQYLANPYIGYYHIYGYMLEDKVVYASPENVPNVPKGQDGTPSGERLVLIQINLSRFKEQALTETALSQLDTILSAWCGTDYSLLLRFIYDWDGTAQLSEPDNISVILQHMEQVAAVYNRYAGHIYSLQGLFTGNYGEMNNTKYGSAEDMRRLASKLAETADPSIYLAVRTPSQWRCVTEASSYEALAAMPNSPYLYRLGLYNDGMFGNATDTGTYMELPREEEIAFQDSLCQTVPNGGEVITSNPYNDLGNAITDMKRMHVSYLNSIYDSTVLDKWKKTDYTGADAFHGVNGYDYVRNHLGYRYVLRSTEILRDPASLQTHLLISIENVGFSVSYRDFSFCLTLLNTGTGDTIRIIPEENSACLKSGETTALDIPLEPEAYPAGSYELYWQTTDDASGETIQYGNGLPLTDYGYLLGTLLIESS